jgi:chemotaxis protein MotA
VRFWGFIFEQIGLIDAWAYVAVLGGTMWAVILTYSVWTPYRLLALAWSAIWSAEPKPERALRELMNFAHAYKQDAAEALKSSRRFVRHPFFSEGITLVSDGVSKEDVREILARAVTQARETDRANVDMFVFVSRFPPACGVIVTLFSLLSILPAVEDGDFSSMRGPLTIAFGATLLGVAISHLFCLPVAARLERRAEKETRCRELIASAIGMIHEGVPVPMMRDRLKSHLEFDERVGYAEQSKARAA